MTTFHKAFLRVFGHEGGFTDNPEDRGNWTGGQKGVGELKGTKFGISAMSYPHLNIRQLTVEQAQAIYRNDFWDNLNMGHYPAALQFQLFDAAVNHGLVSTLKMAQRAVGVKDDGQVGPKTRAALNAIDVNDLLMRFLAERLDFMANVRQWPEFGKGWSRRIANNLRIAAEDN